MFNWSSLSVDTPPKKQRRVETLKEQLKLVNGSPHPEQSGAMTGEGYGGTQTFGYFSEANCPVHENAVHERPSEFFKGENKEFLLLRMFYSKYDD